MKTPLRRRVAPAALLLLAPVIAACGFGVQTDQVYQPAVGVNDRDSAVDALNSVVVSEKDGTGRLVTTLVNNSQVHADKLVSVTGPKVSAADFAPVAIAPDGLVNLADSTQILLTGSGLKPGRFVRVTLTFTSADPVKVNLPVVARTGDYADIETQASASPSSAGSPSGPPTSRASKKSRPSETPSETPGATITPSTSN